MQVLKDRVGETDVYIQIVDEDVVDITQNQEGFEKHGIEEQFRGAFASARTVIRSMANDIASEFKQIPKAARPKQIDVEFSLALSTAGTVWILTSKGECTLKVKMSWELPKE